MAVSVSVASKFAMWLYPLTFILIAFLVTTQGNHYQDDKSIILDWRKKGVISEVSNQGALPNSWSYAARECVESYEAIQTKKLVSLSTDELQDCCPKTCGLEQTNRGFECIITLGGICTQKDYLNGTGKCQNASCTNKIKVLQSSQLTPNREDLMLRALHKCPLLVYIDGSLSNFAAYQEGIYDDPACSSQNAGIAVQLIGYGSLNGLDYWIIKNSWGIHWGMAGYMYLGRGNNRCGVANYVYFPGSS